MRLEILALLFANIILASSQLAEAQQKRVPLIRILDSGTSSASAGRIESFRQGLRELGYVEGQNIAIEYRFADGKTDRFSDLTASLVTAKVDVLVASGGNSTTRALKQASKTIPIVMTSGSDAVDEGLVSSLARPVKFEFIINLKAAKQINLTIPPNVLARADRVIK